MATPEQQQSRSQQGNGERAAQAPPRQPPTGEDERTREGARAMRTLASHFADLTQEVSSLVRDETALARAEITEDISQIKKGSSSLIVGGTLAFGGVLFLLGAITAALALVWPLWLASLVVGVGALILGGIGALVARQMTKPKSLKLDRTMESGRSIGRSAREAIR